MKENYEINDNILITNVETLVSKGKLKYIEGLNVVCSCGKRFKLHGSRFNENLKKYETFCPDEYILVNKDFEIITSFDPETFNSIFTKKEG